MFAERSEFGYNDIIIGTCDVCRESKDTRSVSNVPGAVACYGCWSRTHVAMPESFWDTKSIITWSEFFYSYNMDAYGKDQERDARPQEAQ